MRSSFFSAPTRRWDTETCNHGLGFVTDERSVIMELTPANNLRLTGVEAADTVLIGILRRMETTAAELR